MTETERLRELLDERGVGSYTHEASAAVCLAFFDGKRWHDCWESTGGEINVTFSMTPEQTIAATLVSPVNTFTIDEIEDLYKDLRDSDGGILAAIVDGVRYETDWIYGVEAVRHFIDMLRRRHRIEVDA